MGGFVEDGLFNGDSLRKIKWLLGVLEIEGEMKITLFETRFDGLINEYGPFPVHECAHGHERARW